MKQKSTMRCLAVDGRRFLNGEKVDTAKVEKVADCITNIRSIGEDPDVAKGKLLNKKQKCVTVLILMDNANDVLAKVLSTKLEQNSRKDEVIYESTMFILLYICSSIELQSTSVTDIGLDCPMTEDCQIFQKLNPGEKHIFQSRLKSMLEERNCNAEDMLSFVIMAENFDENSKYVKKVVQVKHKLLPYECAKFYTVSIDLYCFHNLFHSECYDGHSPLPQSKRTSSLSRCSQMVWKLWAASKTLPGKKYG
jgi:hypothetical protein